MFEFGGRGEDGGVDFVEGDLGGAAAAGCWGPGYVAVGVELLRAVGKGVSGLGAGAALARVQRALMAIMVAVVKCIVCWFRGEDGLELDGNDERMEINESRF